MKDSTWSMSVYEPQSDSGASIRVERILDCPQCHGRNTRLWRRGKDRLHEVSQRQFPYIRCRDCDLIFLSERPPADMVSVFYPDNYHPYVEPGDTSDAVGSASFVERALRRLESPRFSDIRELLQDGVKSRFPDSVVPGMQSFYRVPHRGAQLLDFGCGASWFLNRLREFRWSVIGMDFIADLVERVREEGHRGILVSDDGWAEIEDESVDAVRMNHVLEHLYEPKNVLAQLFRKLKPGGRLHVAVPNPDGLSARLFGSRWFSLEAPRHIMMYSSLALRHILAEAGFVDIRIAHERTAKDFTRSLGYLLKDWNLVKPGMVQRMGDEPLLNAWLLPLLWFAGGKNYGDRIHAFAAKAEPIRQPG